MNVYYAGKFKKHFKKRIEPNPNLQKRFQERLALLIASRKDKTLQDHPLKGKKQWLRSFSVTGDIRVVYFIEKGDLRLIDIGTHNQVY